MGKKHDWKHIFQNIKKTTSFLNTCPSRIHEYIRDWSIKCTQAKIHHAGVQVQLAYSHKNKKKGLVAKCSSFIGLCSWELSEGKDRKVAAPGCEVQPREVMKVGVGRESLRPCLPKRTTSTVAGDFIGSFPVLKWCPQSAMSHGCDMPCTIKPWDTGYLLC